METPNRRSFLKSGAAATIAAGAALSIPQVHAAGSDQLRIALVGCGGRGNGAASDALSVDPRAVIVAVADVFPDRAQQSLKTLRSDAKIADRILADESHAFGGFDAYKQAIDAGVDAVLLAAPPHFRPAHLAYAVEKGKHCFVEKPVAVDVPGVQSIEESCKIARAKGLSIVSGLCWRYAPGVQATVEQISNGAIGEIVAIEAVYNTFTLWHRGNDPKWSPMERQVQNWYYYNWLSGDHIVEQAVHSIDKAAWLLGDASPISAVGVGGRQQRTNERYGNIFDHHSVSYEFPNGVKVFLTCRQQEETTTMVDEIALGTRGRARILAHRIEGDVNWKYQGPQPSMYHAEQEKFLQSIRSGSPIDDSAHMCNSTLIGIMGRMCTYTGLKLTWDQIRQSTARLGPQSYEWGDIEEVPAAIPGRTKFV